ncbi:hypothetical protein BDA96_02G377600 [Sorghum bicolor]|uniref:Uncharacterized protein n=2 Tax=Sorghum bicolor TaxID=4558 RepID=A0A921RUC1_SORBI|nr:uncharacterized protein LOC8058385 [Sorghum bicolor]EER97474.1 hypothetical protein SORBI_3002G360600 [Sorghum bicolor]KAG0545625.1 hypothetical protein BDA96_02G377600 [Sorghum bicolor]|eukprot:XP_002460953.1 uncharacterized protein LOC8058385 [Sorghum bicolor]
MDAEKAVAAAEAERKREEEVERLLNKVWWYSLFLYFGTMIVAIAPNFAPAPSPAAAVPSLLACYDVRYRLTAVLFAVVSLAMQAMLALVLERRPAPAPHLTPLAAWPLGIFTWMFVTTFCLSCLSFGVRNYYYEWTAAVTSAGNLAMAARTVMRYLA